MEQNSYRNGNYNRLKRKSTEFEPKLSPLVTTHNHNLFNPMMSSYDPSLYYGYDAQNFGYMVDSAQYSSPGAMYSTSMHAVQPPLPDYEPEQPPPPPPPPSPPRPLMEHQMSALIWNNRSTINSTNR